MAAKKGGKRALGRGLDSLFGEVSIFEPESEKDGNDDTDNDETAENGIKYVSINEIKPNTAQPRKHFSEESLDGLASSIEKHGMIQPVMIRSNKSGKSGKSGNSGKSGYELIAGERRWRAARRAGLKEIPAIIKEVSAEENALFAVIENMQREDLNPMEEAQAFRGIIDDYGLTQEEVAKSVGKSRPYIANTLRLLNLPEKVREYIEEGALSAGHANAIGAVDGDEARVILAEQIVREGLSVREAEALAATANGTGEKSRKRPRKSQKSAEIAEIEEELTSLFGTKVTLGKNVNRGTVEIHYFSKDELDGLIEELRGLKT